MTEWILTDEAMEDEDTCTRSMVIELWNKGLTIQDIASELQLKELIIEDIIECQTGHPKMGQR